jgi:hypothetical protein
MERSEPLERPLLEANAPATDSFAVVLQPLYAGGTETSKRPRRSSQGSILAADEALPVTNEECSNGKKTKRTQTPAQPRRLFTVAHMSLDWKRSLQAVNRMWSKSWTAETCSCMVSILSLAGLVTILLAHQEKPLPQWPQLVTINSIISLFSMVMRACVGVVLAEGTLSALLAHCGVYKD